jgi:hypothetical protein
MNRRNKVPVWAQPDCRSWQESIDELTLMAIAHRLVMHGFEFGAGAEGCDCDDVDSGFAIRLVFFAILVVQLEVKAERRIWTEGSKYCAFLLDARANCSTIESSLT